jgi:protein-disulfide isomerase
MKSRLFLLLLLVLVAHPASALMARPPPPNLVTVRLFIDLDCPASRKAWPVYREAIQAVPQTDLLIQHVPLSVHPLAMPAAIAAEVARRLDPTHDEARFMDALLAEPTPDDAALQRVARSQELDLGKFAEGRRDPGVAAAVEREQQAALAFGIRSTPSALINGRGLSGVPRLEDLVRILRAAKRQAERDRADNGPQANLERIGLLRQAPEFVRAFDALRATWHDTKLAPQGTLGARWRVPVERNDLVFGAEAAVTIVQFLDPTSPWQLRSLATLLKLQADEAQAGRKDIRIAVKLLLPDTRPVQNAKNPPATLQLAARALLAPVEALALIRAATQAPTSPNVAVTASFCTEDPALLKAADAPATSAWLQLSSELSRRTEAGPGTLFFNGRRWFGLADDANLPAALAELRAECKPLPGKPMPTYASLVATGRYLEDAQLDLAAQEPASALPSLPALGQAGVVVHLFVDFRSPHSRAAFYMLRRLVSSPDLPIRLMLAVIPRGSESIATPSAAGILAATRLGRGMEMAEVLFNADKPDDPQGMKVIAKKSKLDVTLLQKGAASAETQDALQSVWRARRHLDMRDEPVIYVGGRLYQGPLDESRLERAVRFVRDAPSPPSAAADCQPEEAAKP